MLVSLVVLGGLLLSVLGKWMVDRWVLPSLLWWLIILLPLALAERVLADASVFERMVGLCVLLLLGMKVIVYMEWKRSGGARMPFIRWVNFAWMWFGMEPRAFIGKRQQRRWQGHLMWGSGCIVCGGIFLTVLGWLDVWLLPLVFAAMSAMFHFGALRILTAFWAWRGMAVRTLFRNPFATTGFVDFWGARWNLAYSHMMARTVQRPLRPYLGNKGSVFAVFVLSGVLHELAITVPAGGGYGLPTLFFVIQGCGALVESKGGQWSRMACLMSLVVGVPVLFPEVFADGVIWPVFENWIIWTK